MKPIAQRTIWAWSKTKLPVLVAIHVDCQRREGFWSLLGPSVQGDKVSSVNRSRPVNKVTICHNFQLLLRREEVSHLQMQIAAVLQGDMNLGA